jgi:hypothetical protein
MFGVVMSGWRAGLACVGGVTLLVAAFWLGRTTSAPSIAPAIVAPEVGDAAARAELEAALDAERERGQELAAQLAWLQSQLARFVEETASPAPETPPASVPVEAAKTGPETPEQDAQAPWFDGRELLDHGLPEGEVARLRRIFDEQEMRRIELRHQAEREGWLNKRRYWDEMVKFQLGLRGEIGDENYDLMLYATGKKNRVVMSEILPGSPAEDQGFEPGDVVVSYDGRRIFHGGGLRHATTEGERGEWVSIDVVRDDELLRLRAQRGPLGVKLVPGRKLPESLW